jgi:hypothetical protein
MSVCFHNRKKCSFCGELPDPNRWRPRPRCITCGRFVKKDQPEQCVRCVDRFHPIPMFAA